MLMGLRRKAVVADLISRMKNAGSWAGETHVQKSLYPLDTLLDTPTGYEFVLYKYGPFSFDLRDELGSMAATGLLDVKPQLPYGPSFEITERGQKVISRFPRTMSRYRDKLDFVASALSDRKVISLERLTTALYVRKKSTALKDVEGRVRELRRLKPHVSLQDAKEATEEIDKLVDQAESFIDA